MYTLVLPTSLLWKIMKPWMIFVHDTFSYRYRQPRLQYPYPSFRGWGEKRILGGSSTVFELWSIQGSRSNGANYLFEWITNCYSFRMEHYVFPFRIIYEWKNKIPRYRNKNDQFLYVLNIFLNNIIIHDFIISVFFATPLLYYHVFEKYVQLGKC